MLYLRVLADLEYARSVARVPRTQDDAIAYVFRGFELLSRHSGGGGVVMERGGSR
jgi:lipoate-protein ligase A